MTASHNARLIRVLMIGSAAAALGAGTGVARAAPAPAADQATNTLQEIVVTARKREENLQTTPLAITALNANMLQQAQVNSINDLQNVVPSLLTKPQPSYGGTSIISLRGFINALPTNLLGDGPVAMYVDGVYLGRDAGDQLSLVDLSRVEVEAGPQGTLFGRNVTGGAISLYSKPPAKTFGLEEKLSYGTYNDRMSRTTLDTGELGDTGFYAKFAYMFHDNEGYGVTNTRAPKRGDEPGAVHVNSYYFALHGNLGPKVTVDYKFDWTVQADQAYAEQPIGLSPLDAAFYGASASHGGAPFPMLGTAGPVCAACAGGPYATVEVQPTFMKTVSQTYLGANLLQSGGHNLTLNYQINDDTTLKSITAYRSLHLVSNGNFGGNDNIVGNVSPIFPTYAPIQILSVTNNSNNQYQLSEELQLNGKVGRVSYVAGLYYFDEHVGASSLHTQASAVLPAGTCLLFFGPVCGFHALQTFAAPIGSTVDSLYDGEAASRAGYLDFSYKPQGLDDKLELSGGIRYTWDTKFINQTPITGANPVTGALVFNPIHVQQHANFFNLAGSGAIKYQWTPAVMTYLRVGNSYRAGGYNPGNTVAGFANVYNPEGVLSYETGIKSDWLDHHLRVDADLYYTDYTGLQVPLVSPVGFSAITENAGRARMFGFEGQITVLPADGWQLDGTLGLIDAKYLQFKTTTAVGENSASVIKFDELPAATANADVQYSFKPLPIGDLTIRADWSYRSIVYTSVDPRVSAYAKQGAAPPFHNVGAEITLARLPVSSALRVDAEVFGKNLLDKRDVLSSIDLISGLGFANEAWGPGRTFGVLLTGKF